VETKIQKKFIDESLGFPVVLINAPMTKAAGQWCLNVNYNAYQTAVLKILAYQSSRLSGNQVAFVRKFFVMTIRSFAGRFGVKHPAVLNWERKGHASTGMSWSTEKDIRLFIVDRLEKNSINFRELYRSLIPVVKDTPTNIQVDARNLAA